MGEEGKRYTEIFLINFFLNFVCLKANSHYTQLIFKHKNSFFSAKMCIYSLRYAVVTGANKGIGYGISKKLASTGIMVVLTARNEKRGLEAVESLKELGLSDFVVYHQLDVTDPTSVAALADFIKTRFGRLDILVCV